MSQIGSLVKPRSRQREGSISATEELLLVGFLGIVFTAIWAVAVGKDVGWDQRNYHYYAVYSWLRGRMNYDIAPAGIQSWFNPLIYVPHYWLINHVRPVVAGAVIGASTGLNFVVIYILARLVLPKDASWWGRAVAFLCGAVGFCDPFFLEFIGTTDVDNVVSLPVLASLCILCWASLPGAAGKMQNRAYAVAGVLLGAAAGLKWTCFVYALAMGLTLLVLWSLLRLTLRRYLWFSLGGLLGFLLTGGYWSWNLWARYGNPFFPNWNRYFHSPWALRSNFRDMRFPPQSLEAAIQLPFHWFIGSSPSSEDPFRDARFAFLFILIFVIAAALIDQGLARLWRRGEVAVETNLLAGREHWWLLLTYFVISYLIWVKLFAIQRYLVPLGLIDGVLLWLALDWLIPTRAGKITAFLFVTLFCVTWARATLDRDRMPYGSAWYGVELVPEVQAPGTLFVMVGDEPMGYIVPFLPASTRTVRLDPSMLPGSETELVRRVREILSQHSGPIRSLAIAKPKQSDYSQLRRFGLALDEAACVQFHSLIDQITSCKISQADPSGWQRKP